MIKVVLLVFERDGTKEKNGYVYVVVWRFEAQTCQAVTKSIRCNALQISTIRQMHYTRCWRFVVIQYCIHALVQSIVLIKLGLIYYRVLNLIKLHHLSKLFHNQVH